MPARLLVVDDDVACLYALSEALRYKLPGVLIDTASGADRALEQLKSTRFDVIMTDYRMPGMDGLGLLTCIKACQPQCAVFIISGTHSGIRERALTLGAAGYLEKPIILSELVSLIGHALEGKVSSPADSSAEAKPQVATRD
jgi:DNA-binding NtrC family response regulator